MGFIYEIIEKENFKLPRYRNGFGYRYNKMPLSKRIQKIENTKTPEKILGKIIISTIHKGLMKSSTGKLYFPIGSCPEGEYAHFYTMKKLYNYEEAFGSINKIKYDNAKNDIHITLYGIWIPASILYNQGYTIKEIECIWFHEIGHVECGQNLGMRCVDHEKEADEYGAEKVSYEAMISLLCKLRDWEINPDGTIETPNCFIELNERIENLREKLMKKNWRK